MADVREAQIQAFHKTFLDSLADSLNNAISYAKTKLDRNAFFLNSPIIVGGYAMKYHLKSLSHRKRSHNSNEETVLRAIDSLFTEDIDLKFSLSPDGDQTFQLNTNKHDPINVKSDIGMLNEGFGLLIHQRYLVFESLKKQLSKKGNVNSTISYSLAITPRFYKTYYLTTLDIMYVNRAGSQLPINVMDTALLSRKYSQDLYDFAEWAQAYNRGPYQLIPTDSNPLYASKLFVFFDIVRMILIKLDIIHQIWNGNISADDLEFHYKKLGRYIIKFIAGYYLFMKPEATKLTQFVDPSTIKAFDTILSTIDRILLSPTSTTTADAYLHTVTFISLFTKNAAFEKTIKTFTTLPAKFKITGGILEAEDMDWEPTNNSNPMETEGGNGKGKKKGGSTSPMVKGFNSFKLKADLEWINSWETEPPTLSLIQIIRAFDVVTTNPIRQIFEEMNLKSLFTKPPHHIVTPTLPPPTFTQIPLIKTRAGGKRKK